MEEYLNSKSGSIWGVSFRLVTEDDVDFILKLRTDERLSRYIGSVEDDLRKQREWIRQYKEREKRGEDYYYIFFKDNKPVGLNRIYNIKGDVFTGGSWVFDREAPIECAIASVIIVRIIAFEILKMNFEDSFDGCHVENKTYSTSKFRFKMKAIIFPGQGCQKKGMGRYLYETFPAIRELFTKADDFLGYSISDVMFYGSELDLLETKNTQPAVFLYEVAVASLQNEVVPDAVAGHSLGEFAALVINKTLAFEDALNLVLNRALIAQKVCEKYDTAMGAVIGLSDDYVVKRVEEISITSGENIYLANYNGPGQIVITGSRKGIRIACKMFKAEGAKRAVPLPISGSFHSPYMEEARIELGEIIKQTKFNSPIIPIYQCVDAKPHMDPEEIKKNLIDHITYPVNWTLMVKNMVTARISEFYEAGTDDTLQKIVRRMYPDKKVCSLWDISSYEEIRALEYKLNN